MGKREIILRAAETIITNEGISNFTLRDVASQSALSPGTIYYYFKTKDDIIMELMFLHMKSLEEDYIEWINKENLFISPSYFLEIIFYKGIKLFNRSKLHLFIINECIKEKKLLKSQYIDLSNKWKEKLKEGIKKTFNNIDNIDQYASLLMLVIDGLAVQEVLGNSINNYELIKLLVKIGNENKKN